MIEILFGKLAGSEIVYPIAEQSDEHQTSHGPDTDIESLNHVSDSDYEEANPGNVFIDFLLEFMIYLMSFMNRFPFATNLH